MRHLIRIMEPKVNIALEAARAGCKELLSFAYRLDQLEVKEKGQGQKRRSGKGGESEGG